MKKMVFGISLILFSMALCHLGELGHVSVFRNDLTQFVYVLLSFVGLGMSAWGFFEKGTKK